MRLHFVMAEVLGDALLVVEVEANVVAVDVHNLDRDVDGRGFGGGGFSGLALSSGIRAAGERKSYSERRDEQAMAGHGSDAG